MLLGKEATARLSRTRVAIFGIGGVGGYALEALVRTGVGHIDIIDSDKVSPSNLNRQIIATERTVGMDKVTLAAERAREINSDVEVTPINLFYSAECADALDLSKYDYIIDAIDTVSSKCTLIEDATNKGVPIISCMGTGGKLNPTSLEVSDIYKTSVCPLARVMRAECKKREIKRLKVVYSTEEPIKETVEDSVMGKFTRRVPGSVVFVPAAAGFILAAEAIKDILGKKDEK